MIGLFFRRRDSTSTRLRISGSRPKTGSSPPSAARCVRSVVKRDSGPSGAPSCVGAPLAFLAPLPLAALAPAASVLAAATARTDAPSALASAIVGRFLRRSSRAMRSSVGSSKGR